MNPSKIDPVYNYDNYYTELKFKLQYVGNKAKVLLVKSKHRRIAKQAEITNPINIKLGAKILLKTENNRKLDKVYNGPFEVITIIHPNVKIKN